MEVASLESADDAQHLSSAGCQLRRVACQLAHWQTRGARAACQELAPQSVFSHVFSIQFSSIVLFKSLL